MVSSRVPPKLLRRHAREFAAARLRKASRPAGGDGQGACIPSTLNPAKLPDANAQSRTDPAGDGHASRAPVQAGAAERPLASFRGIQVDAEGGKKPRPLLDDFAAVPVEADVSAFDKDVCHGGAPSVRDPQRKCVKVAEATHLMLLEENRNVLYRSTNEFLLGW
jgi:hypothetical protein